MRRLIFLLLMIGCLLIPSYAQQQEGRGLIREGVVNNLDSELTSFNPLYCSDDACEIVSKLLFPTLLATDHETRWFTAGTADNHAIAESWSISDDGRIYTFQLRDDALWSDGTPITAYDYFYSFLAIDNFDANSYLLFEDGIRESIEGVVPLGDFELAVIFAEQNCDLLPYADLPVVPVHVFDETFASTAADFFVENDDLLAMWEAWDESYVYASSVMRNHPFNDNPSVSAGDFTFVDWDEREHIRLQSGDVAFEIVPVTSLDQMSTRFLTGELTVMPYMPRNFINDYVDNPDVQLIETDIAERMYINLNLADPREPISAFDEDGIPQEQLPHPILSNPDVRHALELAINREELVEIEVRGRNLAEGVPRNFTLNSNEILEALQEPLTGIVSAIMVALEQSPPELASDISERGMVLTGGGALLKDLDRLLMEETGIPVVVADDPLTCVARGGGKALEMIDMHGGDLFAWE